MPLPLFLKTRPILHQNSASMKLKSTADLGFQLLS